MHKFSKKQAELASLIGIQLKDESVTMAAAKIRNAIFYEIYPDEEKREATENQLSFINELGLKPISKDFLIASAQINEEVTKLNIRAINEFKLKSGVNILVSKFGEEREYIISSISDNYRIWFKGGQGQGC